MNNLIACCGLDCEKCDARIATMNDDDELRKKTAELWARLNNAPILPEHINCVGCCADGAKTYFCSELCEVRKCVKSHTFETCGDCAEFESCKMLAAIVANNPDVLKRLKKN